MEELTATKFGGGREAILFFFFSSAYYYLKICRVRPPVRSGPDAGPG